MEAFTWHNFIRRKDGSPADRYLFQALLVLVLLVVRAKIRIDSVWLARPAHEAELDGPGVVHWQAIYLAAWIVSWVAGGYLSTLSALVSFFVHFAGFYAIWVRNSTGIFVVRASSSNRGCFGLPTDACGAFNTTPLHLQYALTVVAIASLHMANIVLIILTLVWNQSYFYHNELDFDPAFPSVPPALPVAFQLLGVIGNANVRASRR